MGAPVTNVPSLLLVTRIEKSFDTIRALHEVSFSVAHGEIVCLLGPSGCGKSTLLNVIAGLESADSGMVCVDGVDISHTPVYQRGFGLMFQGLALFPHRNVADNIAFGLRMKRQKAESIDKRVAEVLSLVGLAGYEKRNVNQLSGGEQQRVALARSLAPRPKLLMLDEPLSSLDRALREHLMDEMREILTHVGQTAIYVTHDQQEAFALSDRMVIMNAGCIRQIGTPHDIYLHPADTTVASFLGHTNLLSGTVDNESRHIVRTSIGNLTLADDSCATGNVTVLIRPDAASVGGGVNQIAGRLIELTFRGRYTRISLVSGDTTLNFELDSSEPIPIPGSDMTISLNPVAISCLP